MRGRGARLGPFSAQNLKGVKARIPRRTGVLTPFKGRAPTRRFHVPSAVRCSPCGVHKLGPGEGLLDLQADRVYEPYAVSSPLSVAGGSYTHSLLVAADLPHQCLGLCRLRDAIT